MVADTSRAHFAPALLPGDAILIGPEGFHFGGWRAGLPGEAVLRTYLAIACRRPLDAAAQGALGKALAAARAGDLTLANIRLAQAGLARAIGADELRARLAATEWLIDCGTTPDDVLAALDLLAPPRAKYSPDQPRGPAGSGIESGLERIDVRFEPPPAR